MKFAKYIFVYFAFVIFAQPHFSQALFADVNPEFRRLYVVRHGQRTAQADSALTPLGIEQARLLAKRICDIGFDGRIYVSPYLRTVQTGVEIAKLFNKKVILTPEIQEKTHKKGVPDIVGLTQQQLENMFPNLISPTPTLPNNWVYNDNYGDRLKRRVKKTIEKILQNDCCDCILVGHKATVKAALKFLCDKSDCKVEIDVWNCELVYFIVLKNGTIKYVSSGVDFIPPQNVTNNFKRNLLDNIPE